MQKKCSIALALLLALAPAAFAQQATGNIYGSVADESGALLPGASVILTSPSIGSRQTQSDSQGAFRFLRLDTGAYKLGVSLSGFTTLTREIQVQAGVNVNLSFSLKVATVEETVTVTAETPIVDTKRTGTSTNLNRDELEKVPQARDPWAILRTVPGVVVDRVNIAGNESGQQANFAGKGSTDDDAMWTYDGLTVTDMASLGSPSYYDYDSFEEIQVSTGGADIRTATGGIGINFVTKRGGNAFHGGGRYYMTHDDLQASNLPSELRSDARLENPDGSFRDKADHIQQIADYGADLGGPLLKDKLWFWGAYGVQDIRLVRLNGTPDKTLLKGWNAKLNWQPTQSDSVSALWFWARKVKEGRSPGFSGISLEEDSFLFDQDDARKEGTPPGLYKLEWNHVFSPSLYLNAKGAYYGTGFGFTPRGGVDNPGTLDRTTASGLGSSYLYQSLRPQTQLALESNYFKSALGGNHEFKFGFSYRHTPIDSITQYAGRMQGEITQGRSEVRLYRDRVASIESKFASAFASDTFTRDRLAVTAGLRFDRQRAGNRPSEAIANPDFPALLPALNFDGSGTGVKWTTLSPRVGVTYALDEARKTVVRASYARYAGQIGDETSGDFDNPLGISYLTYLWSDLNGDRLPQKSEVLLDAGLQYAYNIDPADPAGAGSTPNQIDPDFKPKTDDEIVIGIDRELAANLAVGLAYTYKQSNNLHWYTRNGLGGREDYPRSQSLQAVTPQGVVSGTIFGADLAQILPGRTLTNRPDYQRSFQGLELTLAKRLSNRWMGRVAFSYNDWVESFEGGVAASRGVQDPTRTRNTSATLAGPIADGGQVAILAGGSGKAQLFTSVKWQLTANALLQLPWSLELAAALFGRQGLPSPVYIQTSIPGEASKPVLAQATVDERRYPNLWNVDVRLAKSVKLGGTTAVLAVEAFNVLNSNTDLTRVGAAGSTFNRLDEVLSPRVVRLGLRFNF